jgi:D-sedoheptulose 7-phosphate isomerase
MTVSANIHARVLDIFQETIRAHQRAMQTLAGPIATAAVTIRRSFDEGGRLLVFGNGGSAADGQHFVTELAGRFEQERRALAAIALTADTSLLTAIANDSGFERIFARQIEALGRPGDVAFGITTSGASRNILVALETARHHHLTTVALTGRDGGQAGRMVDLHLNVPEQSTARVQEVHITVLHALCELIERDL